MSSPVHRVASLFVAAVLAAGLTAPALGQGQGDLRRENAGLRTRVKDLTAELEAARKDIRLLEDQVAELKRQLVAARALARGAGPPTTAPAPPPPVSVDHTDPTASPAAMLAALKASYQAEMAGQPVGKDADDAARTVYMRHLEGWAARVRREFRGNAQWNVKIDGEPETLGVGFGLRLQAVDPKSRTPLGDPFTAILSKGIASRFDKLYQKNGADAVYIVRGALAPRAIVNRDRETVGPFDNPRFIGRYAEFQMSIVAQAIMLAGPDGAPVGAPRMAPPNAGSNKKSKAGGKGKKKGTGSAGGIGGGG